MDNLNKLSLPAGFEPFRAKLEASVRPYLDIQTQITETATLWQSKFLGLPYWPKSTSAPQTPLGHYLYLLAQINFSEASPLPGFPERGILQFYIASADLYGANFERPTEQSGFRIVFHPHPSTDHTDLVTDFSFMPSPWKDNESEFPFEVFSKYLSKPNSCFALSFQLKTAPMNWVDCRYAALISDEPFAPPVSHRASQADYHQTLERYTAQFQGHRIGGYPLFTQADPRSQLTDDSEPYELLLQIDSDSNNRIDILWGDVGICNFFIRPSALAQLDFSDVWYSWDCS